MSNRNSELEMGMNLASLRRTPGSPSTPGRRSAPRRWVLFVIMNKYRGPKCKSTQTHPNKTQMTTKPTLTGRPRFLEEL